jgi:predicted metal-dependent phosphoesterase TrpH
MTCDLHTHSIYSDGTWTPEALIDGAIDAGLSAIALTDHNTVDGLPRFISAAQGKEIEIVTGTEFSVDYNGTELHILGLFITPDHFDEVTELMDIVHRRKEERNRELIAALRADGYDVDYDELASATPSGRINRAHVAGALVEKGYAESIKDAFYKFLVQSAGYYKFPKMFTAREIIDFIKSIGAVPVWAHPFLSLDEPEVIKFLSETEGLCGMECYYSTYDEETTSKALQIADRFGLLPSGGSDFHGTRKPSISLGVGRGNLEVPYEWYLALKSKARQ